MTDDVAGVPLSLAADDADDADEPLLPAADPLTQQNIGQLGMLDHAIDNLSTYSPDNQEWESRILFQLRHTFFLPFEALQLVSDAIHESYARCALTIQVCLQHYYYSCWCYIFHQ
jgi:hypothetical protein